MEFLQKFQGGGSLFRMCDVAVRPASSDFASSAVSVPLASWKGGLIGLAAATVGLASEATQHLEKIVPPVLNSFTDQDSRVRYYVCEVLYNIAKVARGDEERPLRIEISSF